MEALGWTRGTGHSESILRALLGSPALPLRFRTRWRRAPPGRAAGPFLRASLRPQPLWPHRTARGPQVPTPSASRSPPCRLCPAAEGLGPDVPSTTRAAPPGRWPHALLVWDPGNQGDWSSRVQARRTMGAHWERPLDGQEPTVAGPLPTRPRYLLHTVPGSTPLTAHARFSDTKNGCSGKLTVAPSEGSSEGKVSSQGEGGVQEDPRRASGHSLSGQGTGVTPVNGPATTALRGKGGGQAAEGLPTPLPSPGRAPAREQTHRTEPALAWGSTFAPPLRHAFRQHRLSPCSRGCATNFAAHG